MLFALMPEFQDSRGAPARTDGHKPDSEKLSFIAAKHCDLVQEIPPASQDEGNPPAALFVQWWLGRIDL
jgi:hypothetical protein